jgi:outer membrane protein assembly factor BamB
MQPPLELAWEFDTGGRLVASAAIRGGKAYLGSNSGKVFAIDAKTGKADWGFETGARVRCTTAVAGGTVYCGSDGANFYALDATTGAERWRFPTGGPVQASPVVVGGIVIFAANDHNVYALDRRTGRKLWNFRTEYPLVQAPPVVHGEQVFAAQWVDWVYALDIKTGEEQWRSCVPISIESLAFYRDRLWLRSPRQVAELDPQTGKRLRIANAVYGYNGLAFMKNLLFVSGTGSVCALDLDEPGERLEREIPNLADVSILKGRQLLGWPRLASMGTPLVLGNVICFATRAGDIIVTRPEATSVKERFLRHEQLWSYKLGGSCHFSPVAADGLLVVGCDDGFLYGFRERPE